MELMEVDFHLEGPSHGPDSGAAGGPETIHISDSESSTEVEDNEEQQQQQQEEEALPAVRLPLHGLPTAWAFSQRAEVGRLGRSRPTSASQRAIRRQRVRIGLRVHYPSQTAAPSRHFLDFHLRAPAANVAEPESGSTTEVSESDEEEEDEVVANGGAEVPAPIEPAIPGPSFSPVVASTSSHNASLAWPTAQDPNPTSSRAGLVSERAEPVREGSTEQVLATPAPAASTTPTTPAPISTADPGEDTESDRNCPICFEPFTAAGEHRLCTLRCGHLFGHNCIERWLRSQGQAAKCPQCNKKAKRSDIVPLYARSVTMVDNVAQETMKRTLEREQSLRRRAELENAESRQQLQAVTERYWRLQQEVQELKTLMTQHKYGLQSSSPSGSSLPGLSQRQDSSRSAQYAFSKAVLLSQTGGCRVLSYSESLGCLLASQPSPHSTLVPGCGVKKVSTVNMKACQYIPIHTKQIRGLAFNTRGDSLMLSAALDNTIKLTSLLTNTVVQTYNTGKPVWSCCWCLDSANYVYAGLTNGSILVYDTRDTSTHVQELQPPGSRCPVASLSYVPRAASSAFPCGGLVAGSLEGGCFWEQVDTTTYRPHVLPLETGGCTDIQVDAESRHCLVTYRPGRSNPSLRCVLMELSTMPCPDLTQEMTSCTCYPVQTFTGGSSCKLLTKNAVFRSPAGPGTTLVCAGDESSNSTMVWDAGTGALLQKLPADLPVVDITPFQLNGDHYLASLTEKMIKIYKWE